MSINNLFCPLSILIFISSKKCEIKSTLLEKPPLLKVPNISSFLVPIPFNFFFYNHSKKIIIIC